MKTAIFKLRFIPLIYKPARVCKNTTTIIDNIITNCVFDNTLKKAIIESDISDHFLIIFTIQTGKNRSKCQNLAYNKENLTRQTRRLSSNNYLFFISGM